MATLHKELSVEASPEDVWDAVRDVGALHTRLVPGFVVKTEVEADARVVTFGNGLVAREPILSIDDERRRLAWASTGGRATHYNAVLQVLADGGGRTRVVWTIDLLPDDLAPAISAMQDQGLTVMKRTLERKG
ncbi:MAG TPA: SRPBCC family protein [Polyangia bacterium]|jgi:carbon monoxide dehydrogenase subunit G|nr:SRPBCC family protein [Polyangia bacterium]